MAVTLFKNALKSLREADYVFIPVGPSPIDVDASDAFVDVLRDIWERRAENIPAASFVINGVRKVQPLAERSQKLLKRYMQFLF